MLFFLSTAYCFWNLNVVLLLTVHKGISQDIVDGAKNTFLRKNVPDLYWSIDITDCNMNFNITYKKRNNKTKWILETYFNLVYNVLKSVTETILNLHKYLINILCQQSFCQLWKLCVLHQVAEISFRKELYMRIIMRINNSAADYKKNKFSSCTRWL